MKIRRFRNKLWMPESWLGFDENGALCEHYFMGDKLPYGIAGIDTINDINTIMGENPYWFEIVNVNEDFIYTNEDL